MKFLRFLIKLIKTIFKLIFLIILLGIAVLWYSVKVEPFRVTKDNVYIETAFAEALKIVQISDVQISENYSTENFKKVIDKINEQDADIFLFTGDLYENYAEYNSDEELINLLSSIEARYGKYAVWGNRDYGGGASRVYEDIMQQSGFKILCNESEVITLDSGEELFLAGLDDSLLGNPDIEPITYDFSQGEYKYSILMSHEPDVADLYADTGFDLIISGHSHGGQVNVPFMPSITTSLAEKYIKGSYELNDKTTLYVNAGIGTSRYPIRFMVPPEITVFNFEQSR